MQNRCWRFLRSNVARITRGLTGNEIARARSRNYVAPGGFRSVVDFALSQMKGIVTQYNAGFL